MRVTVSENEQKIGTVLDTNPKQGEKQQQQQQHSNYQNKINKLTMKFKQSEDIMNDIVFKINEEEQKDEEKKTTQQRNTTADKQNSNVNNLKTAIPIKGVNSDPWQHKFEKHFKNHKNLKKHLETFLVQNLKIDGVNTIKVEITNAEFFIFRDCFEICSQIIVFSFVFY